MIFWIYSSAKLVQHLVLILKNITESELKSLSNNIFDLDSKLNCLKTQLSTLKASKNIKNIGDEHIKSSDQSININASYHSEKEYLKQEIKMIQNSRENALKNSKIFDKGIWNNFLIFIFGESTLKEEGWKHSILKCLWRGEFNHSRVEYICF